jgi:hypothetical protein
LAANGRHPVTVPQPATKPRECDREGQPWTT